MPAMKEYVVTQTRTVKVTTDNAVNAAVIAAETFRYGTSSKPKEGVFGRVNGPIEEQSLNVERKS